MHGTLLASATLSVWRALENEGYDAATIFRQAGLEPNALPQPGTRFELPAVKRLWTLVLEVTKDPCFGLKVGQHFHPSAAHALGYAWLASDTLLEAFQRLIRYYRVITTDKEAARFDPEGLGYRFLWDDSESYYGISEEEYDEGLAAVVTLCRLSAGEHLAPLGLRMRRPPPPCEEAFAAFFRAPIDYQAGENSILFDRDALEAPLPTGNIQVARECDRVIDRYLAQLERDNIAASTKALLVKQLPSGSVTEGGVATALNLSVRTMQRRLADEGTTFKQLLDNTRRELALQYIRDQTVSINEMTYLLGYSELANFSRAFKRWTGQSPRAMRVA